MLKFIYILLISIILIFILLYVMSIQIKIKTIRKDKDDVVIIRIKTLYGLINMKFEIPLLDIVFVNNKPALKYKAEVESNKTSKLLKKISKIFTIDDFNNIKKYFRHDPVLFHRIMHYWFRKLTIKDFTFILKYGLADAALNAVLYGLVWAIFGSFLALVKNNLDISFKDIKITPNFEREAFSFEFSCIIKFKFGDIINTGIMILKRRMRIKKSEQGLGKTANVS